MGRRAQDFVRWSFFEFASLGDCVRAPVGQIDTSAPVDLFLIQDDGLFRCRYSFSTRWEGYGPDGAVSMRALKDESGVRRPLVNARSFRGEKNKFNECLIWAPEEASGLQRDGDGMMFISRGEWYRVEGEAARAIEEGWATWVLPGADGFFVMPESRR